MQVLLIDEKGVPAMTPYCVIGCTRGTGLQIARQLAARGAAVRCIARDPARARDLLPVGVDIRTGDVTDPGSLQRAGLSECRAIFFAVDITGGFGDHGFFKPASRIRAVTYQGLVNVVDAAREAAFTGRFMLLSGMGSELPSFTGKLLNSVKGNLQRNQRDRGGRCARCVPAHVRCLQRAGLASRRRGIGRAVGVPGAAGVPRHGCRSKPG
jgi:NAD(P)-dependent dehydrogenase (short-subunit alcohol dehydrogenase family)